MSQLVPNPYKKDGKINDAISSRFAYHLATCLVALLFGLVAMPLTALAGAGDLDSTFGEGGIVTTSFGSGGNGDYGNAVTIDANGKIIVGGNSHWDFALTRYNSDGSLDTSFDSDGKVKTTGLNSGKGRSVAIDANGKILIAGYSYSGTYDFVLFRYNSDGSLDTTFGTNGKVTTDFNGGHDSANAMAIDANGKIVVAGLTGNAKLAIARYNNDGSLDTSFDSDGKVTTAIETTYNYAAGYALTIDANGKLLVAGDTYIGGADNLLLVVRYNSDGSLDSSFDSDGIVTTALGPNRSVGRAIAIDTNGKILVAGSIYQLFSSTVGDFAVARYNNDGSLDSSFGSNGIVTTPVGTALDSAYALTLDSNGKIVVVGTSMYIDDENVGRYGMGMVRYNSDGSLDTSFGGGGKVIIANSSIIESVQAVTTDAVDRILLTGSVYKDGQMQIALLRFDGVTLPTPEINVTGNGVDIANGDDTPDSADHTDFGSVTASSGAVVRTFTIQNTGDGDLTVSTPTLTGNHASAFTISSAPASSVAASDATTFQITFDPSATGTRTATVTIATNDSDENPYTFAIQGAGLNSAPTANHSSATTTEDRAKTISLSATDADGDSLSYHLVSQPLHGTVTLVGNSATYTPTANYNGADSFTFQANDDAAASNSATVAMTVSPVNDRPTVVSERITLPEDSSDVLIDVLANDADVDGDSLSLLRVGTPTRAGAVRIENNTLRYSPAANFFGTETFTYTVSDGKNGLASGRVTAVVAAVNDAPNTVVTATVSSNSASFSFSAEDVDSTLFTYQCALDGGAFTTCASPKTYTALSVGAHSFQVRARDNRGLADPTPASHSWTVASATLTIVLDAQPNSGLNRLFTSPNLPRFYLDDTDNVSDTDAYTRTKSFTVLPGSYTITERAANGWHLRDILCSSGANAVVDNATRTVAITVAAGEHVTCTFTEQRGGTVVVRSFADLNGNGLKVASEPYTNGVTIRLYSAPGTVAVSQTTTTLVRSSTSYVGYGRFLNLRPGVYTLCMVPPAGWVATRPAAVMADYDNLPCFAPITVAPAQGRSYLVGNKRAALTAVMTAGAIADDVAGDDPAAEAEVAQLLAAELQAQTEAAETPSAVDAPTSEEAFGLHPLFLPLIRIATGEIAAADAVTNGADANGQPAWDEAADTDLAAESVTETTAIVLVSEPTDASLVSEEASEDASRAAPPATADEAAVVTEATPLRLFLPVVQR